MKYSIRNKTIERYFSRKGKGYVSFGKHCKWVMAAAIALLPFLAAEAVTPQKEAHRKGGEIREVFVNLHTPGLETIRRSNRMDMADYWEADSVRKVMTVAGGAAWLEAMTDNYLRVRVSTVSTVELKLLPFKKGKIVACVYTVGDSVQAKDSEINFYDSALRPLDKKKFFTAPELKEFFNIPKKEPEVMGEIRAAIPFPTVAYSLSPDNEDMTARLTVDDYISQDDLPLLRRYEKKSIIAPWKGKFKF